MFCYIISCILQYISMLTMWKFFDKSLFRDLNKNWRSLIGVRTAETLTTPDKRKKPVTSIPKQLRLFALLQIRDPVRYFFDPWIQDKFFPYLGSLIPDPSHIFWKLSSNFLGSKYLNSMSIDSNPLLKFYVYWIESFSVTVKKAIFFSILWNLWLQNKVRQLIYLLFLLLLDPGYGIEKKIRIRDKNILNPQHWLYEVPY